MYQVDSKRKLSYLLGKKVWIRRLRRRNGPMKRVVTGNNSKSALCVLLVVEFVAN